MMYPAVFAVMCPRPWLCLVAALAVFVVAGCGPAERSRGNRPSVAVDKLFTKLPAAYTNVDFVNRLELTDAINVFTYRHYYNGGGVAIGDVNGDGRPDLYFTSNQDKNRLYLNRGDWWFDDVTDVAGVAGERAWSTGVTLADVNADGRLDIYVCNSGDLPGDDRKNELFINQGTGEDGVPRFDEQAARYNLDDAGYGTQAAFFDYDRDGDLDMYLLNNAFTDISAFDTRTDTLRTVRDALGGDKLYRNDGGHFVDVSAQAGIYGSEIAFGLDVTVGDVNRDGWPDLYISNDFFERDYFYLNNRDGTFREVLTEQMRHISLSSMGADMADINNDAYPEIFVTDMLPETDRRLKTTSTFETWSIHQRKVQSGYYHQAMRNMLHLNNRDGTFSEIGALAGLHATDWSWSALFADFDLDGYKDLYVTNGIRRDLTDQDFIQYLSRASTLRRFTSDGDVDFMALIDEIPATRLPNYAFRNNGDLTFAKTTTDWGLGTPSFSNGAAYGDLDGDGDLDLVVNNLDHESFIYRNEADSLRPNHFLQVDLRGAGGNTQAVGAQVTVRADSQTYYAEQMPTRGFQSTVSTVLTLGVGTADTLDAVTVRWPDGRVTRRTRVAANQTLVLRQAEVPAAAATTGLPAPAPPAGPFREVTDAVDLDYAHVENEYVDFEQQPLMPKMVSTEGPRLATGDVNGDGRMDLYLGGAKGHAGAVYVQRANGRFAETTQPDFDADLISEDVDAAFFDADGDGDQDLYVVSGGNAYGPGAPALQDRLYLNDGTGRFEKTYRRLPRMPTSGSTVALSDYDADGDTDLFVGGRVMPWRYGLAPRSYLLANDGTGRFRDVTDAVAPGLARIGMVTDAHWSDYDGDGQEDLFVVGDWMPVRLFRNTGDALAPTTPDAFARSHGWWNRVAAGDFDADGDPDYILGNWGRNARLQASPDAPATMLVSDFDRNGKVEQIVSYYRNGTSYPMVLRGPLVRQLGYLRDQYPTHAGYAEQTVQDLFTDAQLAQAVKDTVYWPSTSYVENRGDGTFALRALPIRAQFAPMFGVLPGDFDDDGHLDVLLAGNFHGVPPNIGRLDASYGLWLRGDGTGHFTPVTAGTSGFRLDGEARDLALLNHARYGSLVMVARNDAAPQFFRLQP